jgi:hypothetical protein
LKEAISGEKLLLPKLLQNKKKLSSKLADVPPGVFREIIGYDGEHRHKAMIEEAIAHRAMIEEANRLTDQRYI